MQVQFGSEYLLIAIKVADKEKAINDCKREVKDTANIYQFNIPDLKVGTLDTLLSLANEFTKYDSFVESVVRRISRLLLENLNNESDKLLEALRVQDLPIDEYIKKFRWDMAKYPIKQSLRNIVDIIIKLVSQVESDLKSKSTHFNNVKNSLASIEKRNQGNLLSRSLSDIVKKTDFILNSEYLMTCLVVVPRSLLNAWWANYETLIPMVVPRTSKILFEDNDTCLINVVIFKKFFADFKSKVLENRFSLREYEYNEHEIQREKTDYARLQVEKDKIFSIFVKWLKVNFSDTFSAWIHIKALRVFVESVLRYGLPVNFLALVVEPTKKQNKKVRDTFNLLYKDMDRRGVDVSPEDIKQTNTSIPAEVQSLLDAQGEYYPYVSFDLKTRLFDI